MRYDKLLAEKNVLIVGEASALRRAVAVLFTQHGAAVALLGGDAKSGAADLRALESAGPGGLLAAADLGDGAAVERACREVLSRWGHADVLVNLSTAHSPALLHESTEEQLLDQMNRGLRSAVLCTALVAPGMMACCKGSVVNIVPVYAQYAVPGASATASAAGGVYALSKAIALDYCKFDVRSNCLLYGGSFLDGAQGDGRWTDTQLIPRRGEVEEVANAALYLASDMSKHVTGETLVADGGATVIAHKQILP